MRLGAHIYLAILYISTVVFSAFISNNAIAIIMTPIAIALATNLDINPNEIIDNLYSALEKAINDEEYEVAAKIRDRIKQIDK